MGTNFFDAEQRRILGQLRTETGVEAQQEETPEETNYFDRVSSNMPRYAPVTGPDTFAAAFGKGALTGALHPIQGLTGERPAPEDYTMGQSTAHAIGEVVGMGVTFIPFLRASQIGLKGVGLAARMSPTLMRIAEGTLASGLYEAAAGPADEAGERILKGMGFGAAGEVAFIGAASMWRNRFPIDRLPRTPVPPGELPVNIRGLLPAPKLIVHPDALTVERYLMPKDGQDLEQIAARLSLVINPETQLDEAAAKVAQTFRPGGVAIVPGIQRPAEFIRAMRRNASDLRYDFRPNGDGTFEVLMFDSKPLDRWTSRLVAFGNQVKRTFLGDEGDLISYQQAVDEISKPGVGFVNVHTVPDKELQKAWKSFGKGGQVLGFANNQTNTAWVKAELEAAERLSTLVHEYTHHFSWWRADEAAVAAGGTPGTRPVHVADVFRITDQTFPGKSVGEVTDAVRIELKRVTRQQLAWKNKISYEEADNIIKANKSYYDSDTELISRMTELMLIQPNIAKNLAPKATKLMAERILETSPRLEMLLSRYEYQAINRRLTGLWVKEGDRAEIFRKLPFEIDDARRAQFRETGIFDGMEVKHKGTDWEVVRRAKNGEVTLRSSRRKGASTMKIHEREIQRPLLPMIVERNEEVKSAIKQILSKPPKWVGVALRTADGKGVRKAVIDLKNFDTAPSFKEWFERNQQIVVDTRESLSKMVGKKFTPEDVMESVLMHQGKTGLIIDDNGRRLMFLMGEENPSIQFAPETIAEGLVKAVDGTEGSKWITISQENLTESLLRAGGVTDRELEYYMRQNPFADKVNELLGIEERLIKDSAEKAAMAADEVPEVVGDMAARSNLRTDVAGDGSIRVLSAERRELAAFTDEADARDYITRAGAEEAPDLDKGLAIKTDHVSASAGGTPMPKPMEQMSPRSVAALKDGKGRFADSVTLFSSLWSAMENWSKAAENIGMGPAYTRIFRPTQNAMRKIDDVIGRETQKLLEGRTFNDQLLMIEKLTGGMKKDRQELVVRMREQLSKEEIEKAGGFMQRPMTENEIRIANQLEKVGVAEDMPRLMATNELIQSALRSKEAFSTRVQRMLKTEVSPEVSQTIQKMMAIAEQTPTDAREIMDALGLNDAEKFAINIIQGSKGLPKDKFSINAVARHASAPKLPAGFKDLRSWYARAHGMTAQELKLSDEIDRFMDAVFARSNLDSKQYLGGYWPHMRKMAEQGLDPTMQFAELADAAGWTAARFRTGEIDIYSLDPVLTSYKHLRGMLMAEHFDPLVPDLKDALKLLKAKDPRTAEIMKEYIMELKGRPHASFGQIENAIRSSAKALGFDVPDGFVRDIVSNISGLASAASIPFRPALIARNYFQAAQMIAPRTGFGNFLKGYRRAMTEEGFQEAVNAGVVTTNVAPVHATSEIFGFEATKLNRRMQVLLKKGYKWYQTPDDIGRAAAYHAQKARIAEHADDLMKGRIDYAEFKQRAKINTFDNLDIAEFDNLWTNGQHDQATNYIGNVLARESIFRYGHANHPRGWGSVYGRLFGQFGTWPIQYKDYILQGSTRGSTKDILEFHTIHAALNVGVYGAGLAAGLNLWSWVAYPSLNYTGGPMADLALNAIQAFSGSDTESAMAKRNIAMMFPSLENPRSIFVPGSYFLGDLSNAMQADNFGEAVLSGAGVRTLKPTDDPPLDWLFGM